MSAKVKAFAFPAIAMLAISVLSSVVTVKACSGGDDTQAHGLSSIGGTSLSGGGGMSRVATNSPGLLAGSGLSTNPLTATLSVTGAISGTGSSGSPLTVAASAGDIESVGAGSGLTGGGTSGAVTLDIGAGSGLNVAADSIYVGAGSGILAAGGTVAAKLGAGLTFSSGAIVPNLAGNTCTGGTVTTAISSAGTGTCSYVIPNDYTGTHFEQTDEWPMLGLSANGTTAGTFWSCSSSGTAAACNTQGAGTYGGARFGVVESGTGTTTASGHAGFATMTSAISFSLGNWTYRWVGGFETLSTSGNGYAAVIGFADVNTLVDQVDGCYFLYDERASAATPTTGAEGGAAVDKWHCICAANSVRTQYVMDGSTVSDSSFTTVNAPVAALASPNTNFNNLYLVMTGTTKAEFYVNGVKSCEITTHIPSGTTRLTGAQFQILREAGTTPTLTMTTDMTRVAADLTAARSP